MKKTISLLLIMLAFASVQSLMAQRTMKYIDKEKLSIAFSDRDLSDLTDGGNSVLLDRVIDSVEVEVDSYLKGYYQLPMPDPIISVIATDILKYRLFERRGSMETSKHLYDLYENAISRLKAIQKGTLVLSGEKVLAKSESATGAGLRVLQPDEKMFPNGFGNI